jgi:hypothetical protein
MSKYTLDYFSSLLFDADKRINCHVVEYDGYYLCTIRVVNPSQYNTPFAEETYIFKTKNLLNGLHRCQVLSRHIYTGIDQLEGKRSTWYIYFRYMLTKRTFILTDADRPLSWFTANSIRKRGSSLTDAEWLAKFAIAQTVKAFGLTDKCVEETQARR